MSSNRVCIAGGGAAGFFAAIHCKSARPEADIILLEKGKELLAKVVISGGGRCNVTHACFDPKTLSTFYPRGQRELLGPFHQFNPSDTVEWFESRGVRLKTENDGRIFPVSDSSLSIMHCLLDEAKRLGIVIHTGCGLRKATYDAESALFQLDLRNGRSLTCDLLMLATGGNRRSGGLEIAEEFGHNIQEPVPSLFTFHIDDPLLHGLTGLTVAHVEANVAGTQIRQDGPLLVTHWGLSGPAILKLSAWGARTIAALDYTFTLHINWLPAIDLHQIEAVLSDARRQQGTRLVSKQAPFTEIPRRLWERISAIAGVCPNTTWSQLSKTASHALTSALSDTRLPVTGKSMNKEEFVTCGGVSLNEVNMKTMESRKQSGLFLAGEILDIDGVTGGFNFQAAWSGGYLAGHGMANSLSS